MNDRILPQIAKTGGLDDAELAGLDEELKMLIRQTPPSGSTDAHDLLERVRRGEPGMPPKT